MIVNLYFETEPGKEPLFQVDVTGSDLAPSIRFDMDMGTVKYTIFGVRDTTRPNGYQIALMIPKFRDEAMGKIYRLYPLMFTVMQEIDPKVTVFMQKLTAKAKELGLLDKLLEGTTE